MTPKDLRTKFRAKNPHLVSSDEYAKMLGSGFIDDIINNDYDISRFLLGEYIDFLEKEITEEDG